MTNGEHSLWLGEALLAVPEIAHQLKVANLINAAKELYAVGKMTDEVYWDTMQTALKSAGYEWKWIQVDE